MVSMPWEKSKQSAKGTSGMSLNSCIQAGPVLQADLVGVLLHFRKNQEAIMGGIEKIFPKILLKDNNQDSRRFIWRDLDLDANPKVYKMTRVTFGIIASPFMAICTTQEHARQHQEPFPQILQNIYLYELATGQRWGAWDTSSATGFQGT